MIGDMIQSLGVIAAAVIIYVKPDWTIADPICTFLFSILVMFTTVPVFKDCMRFLMESAPEDIDSVELFNALLKVSFKSTQETSYPYLCSPLCLFSWIASKKCMIFTFGQFLTRNQFLLPMWSALEIQAMHYTGSLSFFRKSTVSITQRYRLSQSNRATSFKTKMDFSDVSTSTNFDAYQIKNHVKLS